MSENLSIIIKTILASAQESNLDEQIKKLSAQIKERLELKLKIDASDLQVLTKQTDEIANKLKIKTTMKGSQFINLNVENQAFNEISSRIREVRKNVDELAKVDINTNKKGQMTSATLTYYNKELGQTITETMGWSEAQKKVNGELVKLKTFGTLGFKYSDNMAKARAEAEKFTKQSNAVTNSLLAQRNAIERRDFNYGNLITGVNASTFGSSDNFASYIKKQYGDSAELIGKFNDKQLKTGEIITQANFRVKEGTDKHRLYQATLNKTTGEMRMLDNGLKDVTNRQLKFSEAMKIAITRISQWGIATSLVYGSLRQLKDALTTLKEIDTELIDIAKVTNYTNQEMKELTKTAINAGQEFGRTAQEYLSAVTAFARAGMGQQSEEYAKLSLLLQNVGDITAEVANETLIATDAGFQLGGSYENLMGVIDKFNNISNLNATNINKLSDAMKVGASVFHAAGMSIDETIAIIGTATASTQRSGSEISRAWRTILMNIRQVADEEAEVTEESMKKAEKALNSVGIIVRDSPSTFRPMFDIITDLGKSWNNLSEVQQAYIAESLAGKRQANVLISTLQQFDMVQKQLNESINANGSALQENEIYMQSWEAKAKQLSTTATEFWSNLINTDTIKSFIDGLNGLIKVLDVLVNNSFSSFLIQVALMSTTLYGLGLGFNALKVSTLGTTIGVIALDVAEKGLIVTTRALTATMLASPLFWVVAGTATIYGIIKGIDALTTSLKEQKEAVQTLSSDLQNLQSEYDELKSKDNKTEQEEKHLAVLEAQIEAQKTLLAQEAKRLVNREYSSYTSTDIFVQDSSGTNDVNDNINNIKKYNNELSNLNATSDGAYEKEQELNKLIAESTNILGDRYKAIINNVKILEDAGEQDSEEYKTLKSLSVAIEEVIQTTNNRTNATNNSTQASENNATAVKSESQALGTLTTAYKDSADKIKDLNSILSELDKGKGLSADTISNIIENYKEFIPYLNDEVELRKRINNLVDSNTDKIRQAYIDAMMNSESFYNNNKSIVQTFFNDLKTAYGLDISNWTSLAKAKLDIDNQLIKQLSDNWANYFGAVLNSMNDFNSMSNSDIGHLKNSAKSGNKDAQSILNQIVKYQEVQHKFQEIASTGFDSIKLDELGIKSSSKDQYQTNQYEQALRSLNLQLSILEYNKSKLSSTSQEYRNILQQEIALDKQKQQLASQEADRLRAKLASGMLDQKEIDETKKTVDDLGDTWLDLQKTIDNLNFETVTSNLSKFDNQISILKDNLSTYKSQLDLLSPSSSEYDSKLQEIINTTKEYAQVLKNKQLLTEQELLNDKLTILQKEELQNKLREINKEQIQLQIELQSQLASLANETIQIYKDVYEAQKDAALDAIDEQMEAEEDRHKQITDNLDDELDQYKDIIQAKLDTLDKEESEYDYNKDLTQLQKERQEIQNKLNSLSLDTSDWANSQKEDLTKQLAEKDLAIQEKQHDRSIELQKDNLNYLLDSYESESDAKKEAEDDNYDAVKDSLDKQKKEVEKYWNNIINDDQKFANIRRNIIAGNLDGIKSDFEDFSSILSSKSEILGESITNNLINKMKEITPALQAAKSELDSYTSISNGSSGSNSSNSNSGSSSSNSITKGMTLRDAAQIAGVSVGWDSSTGTITLNGQKLGFIPGTHLDSNTNFNVVDDPDLVKQLLQNVGGTFHEGGTNSSSRITQLVNKLFNLKPNEQVVKTFKDELFIPQNNMPNFVGNIQNLISGLQPVVAGGSGGDTNYHLSLRIDNINGDKNAGNQIFNQIVTGLKKMGK